MELLVKRTTELSPADITAYCDCFERVFKHARNPETVRNIFMNTCLGYSFHTLLRDEAGRIVGGYSAIPMLFEVNGEEMLFAFGVDLMIDEAYRDDASNLLKVIKNNDRAMKDIGVKCFYGFPNDNSYKVNLAFIRMKDICSLSTYLLPYKVGDAKPGLKIFNPFSILFSRLFLGLSGLGGSKRIIEYPIKKKKELLEKTRYQWFNKEDYRTVREDGLTCYWKIAEFEGIKAAFILDVYPLSKKSFDRAVRCVFHESRKDVGLIIYVGRLPFVPGSMIKCPRSVEPKHFHFVAKVLDKDVLSEDLILNPNNWDVNLSSYDLL